MKRFWDFLRGLGGVLLLGGFVWLGVPRGSEMETLTREERLWVDVLCRRVQATHFFEPVPERLTASEWRAVLRAYHAADVDDADAVLERLAARLRGR